MADVALVRQEVAPDQVERLEGWMEEIRSRRDEAIETLQDEGVHGVRIPRNFR